MRGDPSAVFSSRLKTLPYERLPRLDNSSVGVPSPREAAQNFIPR